MGLFVIVFGLIVAYLFNFYVIQRRKFPPGPFPLPFIGNGYSFIFTPLDVCLQKWKDQYGDIMTVWFGHMPIVTLHNSNNIYETFVKDADTYVDRGIQRFNDICRPGSTGLIFSSGSLWRENRRFALRVFRNLGLGRNIMEERVLNEATSLLDNTKKQIQSGQTEFDFFDNIDMTVASVINSIVFGYRMTQENRAEFDLAKKITVDHIAMNGSIMFRTMQEHYEYFKYLPFFSATYKGVIDHVKEYSTFFRGQIEQHLKNIDLESDEEPTDYVEAYLRHQHKLNKDGVENHNFSDTQLYSALLDLWVAGQETTTTTLAWMLIYMIQNPSVQKKCQAELDEFIGDRLITTNDKLTLNYVNAVVAESQRMSNLVPMNVPHRTTRDVEIMGHRIEKGTVIIDQISTVLHDERYFPDAETFKPERFIDASGKFFQPPELMPFGVGKRACLGEGLARLELFIFTANLLNQFEFSEIPGKPVTGERVIAITIAPKPWVCNIKSRH